LKRKELDRCTGVEEDEGAEGDEESSISYEKSKKKVEDWAFHKQSQAPNQPTGQVTPNPSGVAFTTENYLVSAVSGTTGTAQRYRCASGA
jgi:hypothetical protein